MERERIAPALGAIGSGLYVVTARIGDKPLGMLCSFVQQCGFEPPMLSIALATTRPILQALDGHGLFGVHPLARTDFALMKSFARPDRHTDEMDEMDAGAETNAAELADDPFAEHPLVENLFGIPQLADAWGFLACKVAGKIPTGDHILYVANVFDGALQHPGEPMVRTRSDGFGY